MTSLNQYTRLIAILVLLVVALVFWQGYSGFQQFKQFHQQLSLRSATSTSREVVFLMQSVKDRARLFSEQENKTLQALLKNPQHPDIQQQLAKKIHRYFPKHLTFAIADKKGRIKMKHAEQLIGRTCKKELTQYAENGFMDNPVIMHTGPIENTNHFDVLSPILLNQKQIGILFISFKLDEIRRVLSHGEVYGHHLLLIRNGNNNKIELTGDPDFLYDIKRLPDNLIPYIGSALPIENSLWKLVDIPKQSLFSDEYKRLLLQGLFIITGFLCVAALLIWAIKREERKCGSVRGLLAGIEDERRRIAMDMHDQVLSEISHISRETQQLSNNRIETLPLSAQKIDDGLNQVATNIRSIISDLHPHFLDIVGLEESVRECLQTHFKDTDSPKWHIDIVETIESKINKAQRFNLYRIILEAVNNIQKHSNCDEFSIHLTLQGEILHLTIQDNGIGLDLNQAKKKKGLGLRNIEMRAQQLNATLRWGKTANGSGSRFELMMKLPQHA